MFQDSYNAPIFSSAYPSLSCNMELLTSFIQSPVFKEIIAFIIYF